MNTEHVTTLEKLKNRFHRQREKTKTQKNSGKKGKNHILLAGK